MRVVHINATYGIGSTGTIVRDIQSKCIDIGIDTFVAYSISPFLKEMVPNGFQIGNLIDRKIHAVLCRINGMQGYFSHIPTFKLLNWLEIIKPDILHLHNLHNNFVNVPLLLKWISEKNVPTIITLHDCWLFTGGCFHYTSSGCSRWMHNCGHCPRKRLDYSSLLFDCSSKILRDKRTLFDSIRNLYIVGVSRWTIEEAKKGIFRDRPCTCIYNGINPSVFRPRTSLIRDKYDLHDCFVILGPASKWLLPCNCALLQAFTDMGNPYRLVLYGFRGESSQIPNSVITIEATANQLELAELYSMADIFVNCTHEDTFSMINVEAQACGTPVVCYSNTGAKETVNTNIGRLVATDDVDGMINTIKEMCSWLSSLGGEKRKELRVSLSSWASSEFNQSTNYAEYIELYRELFNNSNF